MSPVCLRRISTPLSALTAFSVLVLATILALAGAPGHAAPLDNDTDASDKISVDIVVKSDETYSAVFQISESSPVPTLEEEHCSQDYLDPDHSTGIKDLKPDYKEEGDTRTCILQGEGRITDDSDVIAHNNDEFIVMTPEFNSGTPDATVDFTQSVTVPGAVTEADGGKVDGTKVTFSDPQSHKVKGKDQGSDTARGTGGSRDTTGKSGSTPSWVWKLLAVLPLAVVGGVVGAVVSSQRRKKNQQAAPYTAPAQGYHPGQAFPPQPGQQGYQGPRGQQPYQPPYDGQPGQQPPFGAPQPQPGQQGYQGPQGQQPYQPPYDGQPGQGY